MGITTPTPVRNLHRVVPVALLALILLVPSAPSAQPGPPDPPLGAEELAPGVDGAVQRERIRERIRIMRAWRLTEMIEMDEATAVQLFDHLDAYDQRIHVEEDRLGELTRELRNQLQLGAPDDDRVAELVTEITTLHLRIEQLNVELVRDASSFLSPTQQAMLMVFLPDFNRQIQQMMRSVRGGRDDRPGFRGERRRGPGRRGL